MNSSEKLATQGTQDEEKQNTNTTQYVRIKAPGNLFCIFFFLDLFCIFKLFIYEKSNIA